jgi:ATP-binding protein involved in chromosome partitioning
LKDPEPFPTSIELDRGAQTLVIGWEDGQVTHYTGEQLRWACPCAGCRGEMGVPGSLDSARELPPDELQVTDVRLVGQYALGIGFASGHSTGIYTFRYLRALSESPPA